MSKEYHDRFSAAEEELSEKSAFICESCNKTYRKDEAKTHNQTCCGKPLKKIDK